MTTPAITGTFDGWNASDGVNYIITGTDAFSSAPLTALMSEYAGARPGGFVSSTRVGMKTIRVDGCVIGTTAANTQALIATLKRRFAKQGKRLVLTFSGDGRCWERATLTGVIAVAFNGPTYATWSATFVCEDPYARALTPTTLVDAPTMTETFAEAAPGGTSGFYPSIILAASPAAYWPLGEALIAALTVDSSGNNGNLDPPASTTNVTRGVTGAIANDGGTATLFNGSTNAWINGSKPGAVFTLADVFSFECWIKLGAAPSAEQAILSDNAIFAGWPYICLDATGHVVLKSYNAGTAIATSTAALSNDGLWHHIAIVKNLSSSAVYVDAVAGTTAGTNATLSTGGGIIRLASDASGTKLLNGSLQHVALYTTALTAQQISDHYTTTGLKLYAATATLTTAGDAPAPVTTLVTQQAGSTVVPFYWGLRDTTPGVWPQRQMMARAQTGAQRAILFDAERNDVLVASLAATPAYWPGWDAGGDLTDMSGNSRDLSRPNLISNPGAEANTTGWFGFTGTFTRTTSDPLYGVGAFQSVRAAGTGNQGADAVASVTAGTDYTFSAGVKALSDAGLALSEVVLAVDWLNAAQTINLGNINSTAAAAGLTLDAWGRITISGVAPVGAAYAFVYVMTTCASSKPGATVRWDDVWVGTTASAGSVLYARDGGWQAATIFDGSTGYLESAASGLAPTSDFTVGVWVNPSSVAAAGTIISKASSNSGWALRMLAGGTVAFEVGNATTYRTATTTTATLVAGRWTLIIATFTQATGTLSVWLSSVLSARTGTSVYTPAAGSNNLRLGGGYSVSAGTMSYFAGSIEGAFLHSAVLTMLQIQMITRYGSLIHALGESVQWIGQLPESVPDPEARTTATHQGFEWGLNTAAVTRWMRAWRARWM